MSAEICAPVIQQTGLSEPCFAGTLIEGEKKFNLNKQEAAWLAGTMLYVALYGSSFT